MVDVAQNLRLGAVSFGPMPFLLQRVGEGIGVFEAFDIATASGIAVPVPGAAHPAAGFESAQVEAEPAQAMDRVEAADAGPHHYRIKSVLLRTGCRHFLLPQIRYARRG